MMATIYELIGSVVVRPSWFATGARFASRWASAAGIVAGAYLAATREPPEG